MIKQSLPRLGKHYYQGHAVVFWTNTLENRAKGWLTPAFHATFREIMLHSAVRYGVWCPTYCLMPDHLHLVWMGMRPESDQLSAMRFLRTELKSALPNGCKWQHQAYDHILREEERRKNAFASTCFYILENPVRKNLVTSAKIWPFNGAIVPGYPRLYPWEEGFWEKFWKLYKQARDMN